MEALVLPGLAVTIVVLIGYIAIGWLSKPEGRALGRFARDEQARYRRPR